MTGVQTCALPISRVVITFLPRSKRLLISWLQSPYAVTLEPQKIKSDTVSTDSPSICHEVMGPDTTHNRDPGLVGGRERILNAQRRHGPELALAAGAGRLSFPAPLSHLSHSDSY